MAVSVMGLGEKDMVAVPHRPGRVLILEPHASGHHGVYLRWIVEALVRYGYTVAVVTFSETLDHPSLTWLKDMQAPGVVVLPLASTVGVKGNIMEQLGLVKREFAYWRLFRLWYREATSAFNPDIVFLPYLDYCLYAIGLLGSPFHNTPWAGLAMRPAFHYPDMGVAAPMTSFAGTKKRLFSRLLQQPSLRALLTIDELLVVYARHSLGAGRKINFLPEPADFPKTLDKKSARDTLRLTTPRQLVLVYGSLTVRKGVFEILSALREPAFPANIDVLLAGKVCEDIQQLRQEPWVQVLEQQGRLHIIDRFLNDFEEIAVFSAADIVWLGYNHHYGPSAVLVQAGRMGLPVIASADGIIGHQTNRLGLGVVVRPEVKQSVLEGISRLAHDQTLVSTCAANGKKAFADNCTEVAGKILIDSLSGWL